MCELHMRLAQVSNPFCQQLLTLRVPCIQDQEDTCQAPVVCNLKTHCMSLTSLNKFQFGYELTLPCHALAYIQHWEKTKIAEGQASKQHACVAAVSDIACSQWPPACIQAPKTLADSYLCLLGFEDLQVVQAAWVLAVRHQTGHCWHG